MTRGVDNDENTKYTTMVAKTTMMTTTTDMMRMTTIEKGSHLRLKTEHITANSDVLAWRAGWTDIRTIGRTYGRTQPLVEMQWTHLKSGASSVL